MPRCPWATTDLSIPYHDLEWGSPVHDDRVLFEFLVLEGAQAGLSWETILTKRSAYRRAFADFDPDRVARFNTRTRWRLLANPQIVRNRLKIDSAICNAAALLDVRAEFGTFDHFIWSFVKGRPITNHRRSPARVPATTPKARVMSVELKRRGFTFVGPTICYAFMQAVGMVNDHLITCPRHAEIALLTGNIT